MRARVKIVIAVKGVFKHGFTVIPKDVRLKLGTNDGDKIVWSRDESDNIIVSKAE